MRGLFFFLVSFALHSYIVAFIGYHFPSFAGPFGRDLGHFVRVLQSIVRGYA